MCSHKMSTIFTLILIFLLFCFAFVFMLKSQRDEEDSDHWELSRNLRQPPDEVINAMELKPGMVIGEIGSGRGRYAVKLAARVGEKGKIYANDILESELEYIRYRCKRDNIPNIVTIRGTVTNPRFPKTELDFAFMISTYHHLNKPVEVLKNVVPALKPGGRLVIVERDPEKSTAPPRSCTAKKVLLKHACTAGFQLVRIETFLEEDTIYIFRLKGDDSL